MDHPQRRQAVLLQEPRPYVLTLSCQLSSEARLLELRHIERSQRRWRSLLVQLHSRRCQELLRSARGILLAREPVGSVELVASHATRQSMVMPHCREARAMIGVCRALLPPGPLHRTLSAGRAHDWGLAAQDAARLGLDDATYRLLRELEAREITPEDYELLSRLDAGIGPKTLDSRQLDAHPVGTYWPASEAAEFGMDFWRLPLPPIGDGEDTGGVPAAPLGGVEACACGVCLMDLEAGDEIRTLRPCGHRFHRSCIDHWLLECSTACPVDKQDLSC